MPRGELGQVERLRYNEIDGNPEMEIVGHSLDADGQVFPAGQADVLAIVVAVSQQTATGTVAAAALPVIRGRLADGDWETRIRGLQFECGSPATVTGVMLTFRPPVPGDPGDPDKAPAAIQTITWSQTIDVKRDRSLTADSEVPA